MSVDPNAALTVPRTAERPRDDGRALVGSRCGRCGAVSFPARAVCHACAAAGPAQESFAPTGVLITYTTVHVARPGLPAPYTLGQVVLDDAGPMVFGQIRASDDRLRAGMPVRVVIAAPGEAPRYWFVPQDEPASQRFGR